MKDQGIVVEHLKKSYKKNDVLKDVSFDVKPGTIFALLGVNGAGKTTIINILTTLIDSDDGTATINGYDIALSPGKVRECISLTGQFAAIDDMLSARENLQLICDLRHVTNSRETIQELLEKFDLSDAADRRTMTFSGGMRRRLDIAMSLIATPSTIFLDEPTTGLDPEARNSMWRTIRELAKNGTTVFLTTQYLEEADQLADTVAVLHEGRVVARGTVSELKQLAPKGIIELQFATAKEAGAAHHALEHYDVTIHDTTTIRVASEGHAKQLADIFAKLRDTGLEPTEFSQTSPTLDDVFMTITKKSRGGK